MYRARNYAIVSRQFATRNDKETKNRHFGRVPADFKKICFLLRNLHILECVNVYKCELFSTRKKLKKKGTWIPLASTVCNQSNLMIRGMTDKQVQYVSRSFSLFMSEIRRSRYAKNSRLELLTGISVDMY